MKSWADDAALAQLTETWLNLALVRYNNFILFVVYIYNIIIVKLLIN